MFPAINVIISRPESWFNFYSGFFCSFLGIPRGKLLFQFMIKPRGKVRFIKFGVQLFLNWYFYRSYRSFWHVRKRKPWDGDQEGEKGKHTEKHKKGEKGK